MSSWVSGATGPVIERACPELLALPVAGSVAGLVSVTGSPGVTEHRCRLAEPAKHSGGPVSPLGLPSARLGAYAARGCCATVWGMTRHRLPGVVPQVYGRAIVRQLASVSASPYALAAVAAARLHVVNLAGNPHLPESLWDVLWARADDGSDDGTVVHQAALAGRPLSSDRQALVASRVRDYWPLVTFVAANPDLPADLVARLRVPRRRGQSAGERRARLLVDAAARPYVPRVSDAVLPLPAAELVAQRATRLVARASHFPEGPSAAALAQLLDPHGQVAWDAAVALLWDGYAGTLGELVDTAAAL
jgi:hypothetical protein